MHSPGVTQIGCCVLLGWLLASRSPSATSPARGTMQDCSDWSIADGQWTGTFSATRRSSSQSPGLRTSGEATVSGSLEMTQHGIVENTTVSATGRWKAASKVTVEPGPPTGEVGYRKTGEGTMYGGRVIDPDVFRPGARLRWIDWRANGSLAITRLTPEGDEPVEPLPHDWSQKEVEFLIERVSCVEISGTVGTLPIAFELPGAIQTNVVSHFELRHHAAGERTSSDTPSSSLFGVISARGTKRLSSFASSCGSTSIGRESQPL